MATSNKTIIDVKAKISTEDGKYCIESMELDNIVSNNLPAAIYLRRIEGTNEAQLRPIVNNYLSSVSQAQVPGAFNTVAPFGTQFVGNWVGPNPNLNTVLSYNGGNENTAVFVRLNNSDANLPKFGSLTNLYINRGNQYKTLLSFNNEKQHWDIYGFSNYFAPATNYYNYLGYISNSSVVPTLSTGIVSGHIYNPTGAGLDKDINVNFTLLAIV